MRTTTAVTLLTASACAAALALAPAASAAHGGLTVTGLTVNDGLVTFLANAPGDIESQVKVTGVTGDLQAIDFRPLTGDLYGFSVARDGGRLYLIDPATGAAVQVGNTVFDIAGNVSIDFNPAVDRLRVVSDDGTNLRINQLTGALVMRDGALGYVDGDDAEGTPARIAAVAYTNNDQSPTVGTQLFDLDAGLDRLALQDPPNDGGLKSIGALPQATRAGVTGFDIYTREDARGGQQWAFVSLWDDGRATFYEIDLATGAAKTFAANPADPASGTRIGGGPFVTDIALAPAQGI